MSTFNSYYSEKNWDTHFPHYHRDPLRTRAVEAWVTVVMDRSVFDMIHGERPTLSLSDAIHAERQGYDDIHHKLYEENVR